MYLHNFYGAIAFKDYFRNKLQMKCTITLILLRTVRLKILKYVSSILQQQRGKICIR